MVFIAIGCAAFIFLYIFDLNKIFSVHRVLNLCFAIGITLLTFSTLGILLSDLESIKEITPAQIVYWVLAVVFLILLLYSLFFALPFVDTYVNGEEENIVIDTGVYAFCRHPGVIWFIFLFFFLWLASGLEMMFWAGLVWTAMDILHVYVQDRWLFPKCLVNYESYKRQTPFLIPNIGSIKKCISTF